MRVALGPFELHADREEAPAFECRLHLGCLNDDVTDDGHFFFVGWSSPTAMPVLAFMLDLDWIFDRYRKVT